MSEYVKIKLSNHFKYFHFGNNWPFFLVTISYHFQLRPDTKSEDWGQNPILGRTKPHQILHKIYYSNPVLFQPCTPPGPKVTILTLHFFLKGIVTTWPFNLATFLRLLPAYFRFQQNSPTPSSSPFHLPTCLLSFTSLKPTCSIFFLIHLPSNSNKYYENVIIFIKSKGRLLCPQGRHSYICTFLCILCQHYFTCLIVYCMHFSIHLICVLNNHFIS